MRGYTLLIVLLIFLFLLGGGFYLIFKSSFNFNFKGVLRPIPSETTTPRQIKKEYIKPREPAKIEYQEKINSLIKIDTQILSKEDDKFLKIYLSGYDYKNNEIIKNFEIKILPRSNFWYQSSKYFQTKINPQENLTLIIRGKNKYGEVSENKILNIKSLVSPYVDKIRISILKRQDPQMIEFLNITTSSINLENIKIKSNFYSLTLQKTNKILFPFYSDVKNDLTLKPNERLIVIAQKSPVGVNFMTNKCLAFYPNLKNLPYFPYNCYLPDDFSFLVPQCQEKLKRLRCDYLPLDFILKEFSFNYDCMKFVEENFTYKGCFNKNSSKFDFLTGVWFYFIGDTKIFEKIDSILFLDQNNLVIEKINVE
jgi:hypothetical protein